MRVGEGDDTVDSPGNWEIAPSRDAALLELNSADCYTVKYLGPICSHIAQGAVPLVGLSWLFYGVVRWGGGDPQPIFKKMVSPPRGGGGLK